MVEAELKALPTHTVQGPDAADEAGDRRHRNRHRQAFTNTLAARIGHHNDCFLTSPDDYGTYLSDPINLDQYYLAVDR